MRPGRDEGRGVVHPLAFPRTKVIDFARKKGEPMGDKATTFQLEGYTPEAQSLVAAAQGLADERGHAQVEPLHLLARALDTVPGIDELFRKVGADPAELMNTVENALKRLPKGTGGVAYLSARLIDLLGRAKRDAEREKAAAVDVEHLLHALSQEIRGAAGDVLASFQLGPGVFRPHISILQSAREAAASRGLKQNDSVQTSLESFTRDLVAIAKLPTADPVIGLDAQVRRLLQVLERRSKNHPLIVGEPGVGKTALIRALASRIAHGDVPPNLVGLRLLELDTGALVAGARLRGELEERVKSLVSTLTSDQQRHEALLVVENFDAILGQGAVGSGVGELLKPVLARGQLRFLGTTTPEGIRKIQDRDAALLRRLTFITLDPPTVEQAVEILRGITTRYEQHHHVRIGESAIVAAVNLAKRYLQDRELPDSAIDLLDETASRKRVETEGIPPELDDLIRRLESVRAQEAALADDEDEASVATRARLERERAELEPKVRDAKAAVESRRGAFAFVQALRKELEQANTNLEQARGQRDDKRLGELNLVTIPDLKRRLAAAEEAMKATGGEASNRVTDQDVAITLGAWTGIPVAKMLEAETEKLLRMEDRLKMRVVGQDEALLAVSRAVRRGRVGLRDPKRPIGSFLFLGPSGVGKTELAKALAEFLFDDEQALTRLDMSEFMERHMAQRLLGAPPGYVDSEQGGFLTEAVRRRPYSVLLFDEVEKAHGDVFNLLLQLLDDGRLTDGRGRTADFSNTVVIMTSNIGAKRILEAGPTSFETEEGREALRDVLLDELRGFFRPEFLNRIDDVVVFRHLTREHLRGIVDIQLRQLDRLLADRGLRVQLTEAAKMRLVDLGYDPAFGARPVRRALLREVQNPLAEHLLSGTYEAGHVVMVDVRDDVFVFEG
ncbi:MAG TPA: AAA family ATPase [Polyangiaceae bacterium]|jgi:ATP-dependent Clp protease ATP-binding subunit ClpB|nr:MAG: Chaperone protein ClpB [Deltaproteobacteria bacterium ADurb.Bin207]HNS95619.1 AAA family ATPase [Polyangiaceae bacterium]HNZ21227.1 AAA family ATPase [Polyangiaceae bacterium]HOD21087.1 AAA family ATPase [Polyangiaceae bacterium]HOE48027.1 AAA family ATPase [Polyangiaceae bacterium]